jgi:protein-S-isoprenylcysteine O-methyltransferase Ste14
MDPINIIVGINVVAVFAANFSGAKTGFKTSITQVKEKPKTYLQNFPLILATLTLIALVIGLFEIGTLPYDEKYKNIRVAGLIIYLFFSWFQVWAYKSLGANYSQDIVILNKHNLIDKGPYKFIRHPHYLAQILIDLGAAAATLSFVIAPLALIEIPILIQRAVLEEKLLQKYFKDSFIIYKKKTGFMIPFIG